MGNNYKFSAEEIDAIEQARETCTDKKAAARLEAIYLIAQGKSPRSAANAAGLHPEYMARLVARYREKGLEAFVAGRTGNKKGGNRRRLMSTEDEAVLLAPFKERVEKGETVETREIWEAFETAVGRPVDRLQIYNLMRRHGMEIKSRRLLTPEAEDAVMAPFKERAKKGEQIPTSEVKAAYERAAGHQVSRSQIYSVLRRHGWESVCGEWRVMDPEEENALIAPFKARAEKGEQVPIREVREAYERAVGHPVSKNQIYSVLRRQGWESVCGDWRVMDPEEENALMAPFKARAEKGEQVPTSEVKAAYERAARRPVSESQIHYVLHRHGLDAKSRRPLSPEAEDAVMAPFKERAKKGEQILASEVKEAYERAVGRPVGESQIYSVLRRHGLETNSRRLLSHEAEDALMAPFKERAKKGEQILTSEVKEAYERAVGRPVGESQIYSVLRRHGLETNSRRLLNHEAEDALMAPFKARAEKGDQIPISEVKEAYERAARRPVSKNQIYRVLHRHGLESAYGWIKEQSDTEDIQTPEE